MKKILLFFAVASCTALAQITINSSDVANMFAIGNTATIHEDTLQSNFDIGSPGGGNNWDFTNLQSNLMVTLESIDPATSPYINDFPTANICNYSSSTIGGNFSEIWTYSKLNGQFDVLGNAAVSSALPGFVTEISYDPYRRQYEHPFTINSQWSDTYTQTISINGTPVISSSVSINTLVDAYGTMIIPGGASYEALRIREELTISGITTVNFSFISKNGAQVNVNAVSSNPPNSGMISVDGTTYYDGLVTSVEQINEIPNNFILSQNYPNPFNPTTNIEYSIPEQSFVELKVFDVLGNEVAALVNKEQTAGVYRADFNAANLPSGMYFARLTADQFTQVVKMTLMK
ncbi:MAG: T9SS type A sorting domain-containing protein [Ignavibacteriaceae bacterium]|nr:T9SS type A sorting domain-containing protein [Ignavibacteriaceae bacterium]